MVWALIGGSGGLDLAQAFQRFDPPASRYGAPSPGFARGAVGGHEVVFVPRHGIPHAIAPHRINYRANVDVLRALGARGVVALNTVGGIGATAAAGSIHVPEQIIDYTWGREHTFSDADQLIHADFADPLDRQLRQRLIAAGTAAGVGVQAGGVYGATQGPRFETAAEITRMARDGCTLVGMTGMPEAGLAREAGLPYAMLSLVVNPAAGQAEDPFDLSAIAAVSAAGMARIEQLLIAFFGLGPESGESA